jgi:tRNA 2-thiocytidine biosynthesis protein TtcA
MFDRASSLFDRFIMKSDDRHIQKVAKSAGSTIFDYKLLSEGNRVLIGLSGGKDSLSLVDILGEWNARSPVKVFLHAAHIECEGLGYSADGDSLREFCEKRNIPFYHRTVTVDFNRDPGIDKCFICAWHRRKALFALAKELDCNRLAFGHHLDDIVITLLMNMSFQGSFSTMPVKVSMFEGELSIIRPLGRIEEKDIIRYADIKKLPIQGYSCPFGIEQSRAKIRDIVESLASLEPRVKRNIFNSMSRIRSDYLS